MEVQAAQERMMNRVFRKILSALRVLYERPLMINAYVEVVDGRVASVNWGDDINYHFIKFVTNRPVAIYFNTPVAMALRLKNYLCIGSTINFLPTRKTIVWGAGVIDDSLELRERPDVVRAVRGPLSREYLLEKGIPCPEVYGDPALLIPYFYRPSVQKSSGNFRIGIVPHYADQGASVMLRIRRDHPEVEFIDIVGYGNWTDFIDRICACDVIFSSSLHGLIVAEAYGVPNHWISISDSVLGNGFKFRDYFASIGKPHASPIFLGEDSDLIGMLDGLTWTQGRLDVKRLLNACPFEIVEPVRYEHPMAV